MQYYGLTDLGLVREENQDNFRIVPLRGGALLAVVCDGMGGARGGSVAATIAVDVFSSKVRMLYDEQLGVGEKEPTDPQLIFRSALYFSNLSVFRQGQSNPMLRGMGTTIAAALVERDTAHLLHVGDSRIYSLYRGALTRLSHDHSYVQELIDRGEITEEQARCHPQRNLVTRALGVQSDVVGEYSRRRLKPGELLLLCSDGLHGMLDDGAIAACLGQYDTPQTQVPALIREANGRGGSDNITAVVIGMDER